MSDLTLTRTRIKSGLYEGLLTTRGRSKVDPVLELRLLDAMLGEVAIAPHPDAKNTWLVKATIPNSALNEGVQTFIISNSETGKTLDSFAIITGHPLQEDLRAEIALIRAELDIVKQVLRSRCVETDK